MADQKQFRAPSIQPVKGAFRIDRQDYWTADPKREEMHGDGWSALPVLAKSGNQWLILTCDGDQPYHAALPVAHLAQWAGLIHAMSDMLVQEAEEADKAAEATKVLRARLVEKAESLGLSADILNVDGLISKGREAVEAFLAK